MARRSVPPVFVLWHCCQCSLPLPGRPPRWAALFPVCGCKITTRFPPPQVFLCSKAYFSEFFSVKSCGIMQSTDVKFCFVLLTQNFFPYLCVISPRSLRLFSCKINGFGRIFSFRSHYFFTHELHQRDVLPNHPTIQSKKIAPTTDVMRLPIILEV